MPRRTRREFLEDSMFATAAAMATTTATNAFAQEQETPKSANERLNVAVVGVRGRGGSHIGAFAGRQDTQVTWVVDPDRNIGGDRAEEIGKRQNGQSPKFATDLREMLEDSSVDIVSIATPNHWHALASIWAIQAGNDVYVEKPVSHNVSEGRRIVEAARKYEKIVQTGTQCRSNPGMREAIKFVQDGGIGQLKVARGLCYKRRGSIGPRAEYKVPPHIDYNLWLGPAPEEALTRPQFHYDWHWQWSYGNGDLGNQGIHQMDLARWGLGESKLCQGVFSYGGRLGYEDAGETANTQVVVHDYGDTSLVFEVRGLNTDAYQGAKVGVIFEGTDGYVVMTSYDSGTAFDLDGQATRTFKGGGDHFGNFKKAVRSRKISDLNADIEEGRLSSALCHLGNISYSLGESTGIEDAAVSVGEMNAPENMKATFERTMTHLGKNDVALETANITLGPHLKFDPNSETFVNHATADTMLTRQYRAPFIVPKAGEV